MIMRILFALAVLFAPALAQAQGSPGFVYGQVPTAAQWNSYFAAKQDYSAAAVTGPGAATPGNMAVWGVYPNIVDGGAIPAGASPANPTATATTAAINGVATTFMRSDAAPALGTTTGSGSLVRATSPSLVTPALGAASASSLAVSGVATFTAAPVFTDQSGSRTALGLGSAATLASGVVAGDLAPVVSGQVLQKICLTTSGASHSLTSYQVMAGSIITVTPRSTNSKIHVTINFNGASQFLGSTNTSATFNVYETNTASIVGNAQVLSVTTAGGGNGITAAQTVSALVTNAALTARTFGLAG